MGSKSTFTEATFEKTHSKFCESYFSRGKRTSKNAVKGELGTTPVSVNYHSLGIIYWCSLISLI